MPTKLKVVLGFALAFVLITLFEVVTQREDWPFSCYPMYSKLASQTTQRSNFTGVSDEGEFVLTNDQTSPYTGPRLLSMARQLPKKRDKGRSFIRVLGARYETRREKEHWPPLQAVRVYSETWAIRPRLAGIDKPARSLEVTLYIPPAPLLKQLKAESAGTASLLAPVSAPSGDRIIELDAASCGGGCSEQADPLAAHGSAVSLEGGDAKASVAARVELESGQYAVLVRMKMPKAASLDRVYLELDGKRVGEKGGIGNYADELPYEAWVWASRGPGLTALLLNVPTAGEHVFTLSTSSELLVDQLWLRRKVRELPMDNAPRQP